MRREEGGRRIEVGRREGGKMTADQGGMERDGRRIGRNKTVVWGVILFFIHIHWGIYSVLYIFFIYKYFSFYF